MYFVYLIVTKNKNRTISYVGYTKDINKRLKLHNKSKGAKFTRGRKWKLAYFKTHKLFLQKKIKEIRIKVDSLRIIHQ